MKRKFGSNYMRQITRGLLIVIGIATLLWLGSGRLVAVQGPTPSVTPGPPGILQSQCLNSGQAKSSYHTQTGKIRFVGTEPGKPIPRPAALSALASLEDAARGYLSACGSLFGLHDQAEELIVMRQKPADTGRSMVRFRQVYQGIPVLGGELIVQLDDSKNIISVSGEILPDISVKTIPAVDGPTAQQNALQAVAKKYQLNTEDFTTTQPELWIYNPVLIRPGSGFTSLVWRMDV